MQLQYNSFTLEWQYHTSSAGNFHTKNVFLDFRPVITATRSKIKNEIRFGLLGPDLIKYTTIKNASDFGRSIYLQTSVLLGNIDKMKLLSS